MADAPPDSRNPPGRERPSPSGRARAGSVAAVCFLFGAILAFAWGALVTGGCRASGGETDMCGVGLVMGAFLAVPLLIIGALVAIVSARAGHDGAPPRYVLPWERPPGTSPDDGAPVARMPDAHGASGRPPSAPPVPPARTPFSSGERFAGAVGVVLFVGGAGYAGWAIHSGQQCMATTPDEICGLAYISAALFGTAPALIGLLMSLVVVWRRSRRLPVRTDHAAAPWQQVHRRPPDRER